MKDRELLNEFVMMSRAEYLTLVRNQELLEVVSEFIRRGDADLKQDLRLILGMNEEEEEIDEEAMYEKWEEER